MKNIIVIVILTLVLFYPKIGFSDAPPLKLGCNLSSQFVPKYATRIHLMFQLFNYKQLINYESSLTSLAIWPYQEKDDRIRYRISSNITTFPLVFFPLLFIYAKASNYWLIPISIVLIPNSKFIISIVKNFDIYVGENTDYYFTYDKNIINTETVIGLRYQFSKWALSIEGKKPWVEKYKINNNIQFQINIWYYFWKYGKENSIHTTANQSDKDKKKKEKQR